MGDNLISTSERLISTHYGFILGERGRQHSKELLDEGELKQSFWFEDIVFPGLIGSETTADNIIIDKISAELKVTFGF